MGAAGVADMIGTIPVPATRARRWVGSSSDTDEEDTMATTRSATTEWQGTLTEGSGRMTLESSGVGTFDVTWASRAEEPRADQPRGADRRGALLVFSMAFSGRLAKAGATAPPIRTTAEVDFQPGEGTRGPAPRHGGGPRPHGGDGSASSPRTRR